MSDEAPAYTPDPSLQLLRQKIASRQRSPPPAEEVPEEIENDMDINALGNDAPNAGKRISPTKRRVASRRTQLSAAMEADRAIEEAEQKKKAEKRLQRDMRKQDLVLKRNQLYAWNARLRAEAEALRHSEKGFDGV